MNGRIYDPVIGRFMSPDFLVQAPANLQSYNRYAYGFNNPLAGTDPSGQFFGIDDFFIALTVIFAAKEVGIIDSQTAKTLAGISTMFVLGPQGAFGTFAGGGLAQAGIAGFAGGFVSSGSLEGGVQGAFTAGLFYGAGFVGAEGSLGRFAAHAAVGCVSAAAGGGQCGSGAMSAGLAQLSGGLTKDWSFDAQLVAKAVVGGTASVIGGGKFANGALTASFGHLFNDGFLEHADSARPSFGEVLREGLVSGRVRDDIFDYGSGLVEGAGSVAKGVGNSFRFLARGTGLIGGGEQLRWQAEGLAVNAALKEYATNSTARSEVNATVYDVVSDNASARNIGRLVGRSLTGFILAPAGGLAAIGDGTRSVERAGVKATDAARSIILGY